MIRAACGVVLLVLGGVLPAAAQIAFVPRFDFHISAEHLSHDSPRFVWDVNFGGELDIIDYGRGRVIFETNYQTILGEEFKNFDPNQGNYILAGVASYRTHGVEIGGTFYHQSRHLSDRLNRTVVDWNMFGARVSGGAAIGQLSLNARVDARKMVRKYFVDYEWEVDSRADVQRPVHSRVEVFGRGALRVVGVDDSRNRGTLHGLRGEGGVRVRGTGCAMEFFVLAERRIDPYPVESFVTHWVGAGFRLQSP